MTDGGESTAGVPLEWRQFLIPFSIRARVLQVFIKGLMSLKNDFILPSAASLASVHSWKAVYRRTCEEYMERGLLIVL